MQTASQALKPSGAAPFAYPDIDAATDINKIRDLFFINDCVLLRKLHNPAKLAHFLKIFWEIYARDDAYFKENENHATFDPAWLNEYRNGWILDARLRKETGGVFGCEDILGSRRIYDIVNALLGPDWFEGRKDSQIRRLATGSSQQPWNSPTSYHLDAQWNADHIYFLNIWSPLTHCGERAPGVEFVLTSAEEMRKFSKYDPAIPYKPRGPGGVSPRMDYTLFSPEILQQNYAPERFWTPVMEPGDALIFSPWCTHRTSHTPAMAETRTSIEWRLFLSTFDTPMRPASSRP